MASELLIHFFPPTFPEPITQALFQLAQDALGSPRVQEAEAGAVLMKTILQKYELLVSPPHSGTAAPENTSAAPVSHQGLHLQLRAVLAWV